MEIGNGAVDLLAAATLAFLSSQVLIKLGCVRIVNINGGVDSGNIRSKLIINLVAKC